MYFVPVCPQMDDGDRRTSNISRFLSTGTNSDHRSSEVCLNVKSVTSANKADSYMMVSCTACLNLFWVNCSWLQIIPNLTELLSQFPVQTWVVKMVLLSQQSTLADCFNADCHRFISVHDRHPHVCRDARVCTVSLLLHSSTLINLSSSFQHYCSCIQNWPVQIGIFFSCGEALTPSLMQT